MEVEGPIDERTLVERFANKKTIVEGSVAKNTANKKGKLIHFYLDYWELRLVATFIFKRFIVFPFQ